MFDAAVRRALEPGLERAGGVLARAGVTPIVLTGAGLAAGVACCVAVSQRAWALALVLWLVNRALDGLDGPTARHPDGVGPSELGGFLDIVADFTVYAGFVLALAVAIPEARLACIALLTAYYVSGTAFLALSSLLERRGTPDVTTDRRSLRFVGGLAEGTETVVAYAIFCLFPGLATVVAWVFTAMVGVTAFQRVALGVELLRRPLLPTGRTT